MTIRKLLLALVVVSISLLAVTGGLLVHSTLAARQALQERHMLDTARALATALDQRFATARAALEALATSPALAPLQPAVLHAQMVEVSRLNGNATVVLVGADGRQRLNSRLSPEAPDIERGDREGVRRVFERGEAGVSAVFLGTTSGRHRVSVDVPVTRDGRVEYDLSMTLPVDFIQDLVASFPVTEDWRVTVLDQRGVIAARSTRPETFVGTPAQPEILAALSAGGGALRHPNVAGIESMVVLVRSALSGWGVTVGAPTATLVRETLWSVAGPLSGVALVSAIGLVGLLLIGRLIARSLDRLVPQALALGRGEPVAPARHPIREIALVLDALHQAATMLRERAAERDQARERIRQSEARFRDFAESAGDWLWESDADGKLVWVSDRFEAITGIPVERMIGTSRDVYRVAGVPDTDIDALAAAVTARQPYANKRIVLSLPDGRMVWFRASGRPRFDAEGRFLGYRGAATDITAEMQADARRQHVEKMAALGRMAGGIAHDFNNVLGAITGFAEFLREDLPEDREQHGFAVRIQAAAARAKGLVRQILSFARSTSETRRPLPLGDVVADLLPLVRAALPSTLQLDLATAEAVWVEGNETEITQIVLNLCVNAGDALEGRAGTIRLSVGRHRESPPPPADGWKAVSSGDPAAIAEPVCLTVADDGAGIPPEIMTRAFEPFFTTKPVGRGTGLGLAVVHGIVSSMGGVIEIASRPGAGTVVRILLPATAPAAAAAAAPARMEADARRCRVLLAEDDPDVAAMVSQMLARLGHAAHHVADGAAGIAAIEADPAAWDLLLTDLAMPGASGLELIQVAKRRRPDLPCILMTGYLENLTEEVARVEGADALLYKPADQATLAAVIERQTAQLARGPQPSPT